MWRPVLVIFSVVFLCVSGSVRAQQAERKWTSNEGVTIDASLIRATDQEVILKLRNGQEAHVPLARLSKYDLNYLKELRKSGQTFGTGKIPEETAIDPNVETEGGPRIFKTPHFEFVTDKDVSTGFIAEAARVFEGTFHAIESLPIGIQPRVPKGMERFRARFMARPAFEKEISGSMPAADEVVGVYLPLKKEILVPFTSIGAEERGGEMTLRKRNDTSTLVHEISHQVMSDWLPLIPVWMAEGLSEYLAAVPYQNGRFEFKNVASGLKERLQEKYGTDSPKLKHPADFLMGMSDEWQATIDDYQTAMMLIYYFMHIDRGGEGQALAAYLALIRESRDQTDTFILDYNLAVKEFEKERLNFNANIERYNLGVVAYRKAADDYRDLAGKYNQQVLAGVFPADRIKLPEKPEPPIAPTEPVIPEILKADRPDEPIDIVAVANAKGRPALMRGRDLDAIAAEMKAGLAQIGIPVTFRAPGEQVGRFNRIGEELNKRFDRE